jgi:hypothetical protein
MTCPDMSSLAVVVEKVPTPCAGGGAVGRVLCVRRRTRRAAGLQGCDAGLT